MKHLQFLIKVAIWLNSLWLFCASLAHLLIRLSVGFAQLSVFPFPLGSVRVLLAARGETASEGSSRKNVSNLVAKRQIYTCASYGEGCSPEKPNDCLRAAQQCLSR